MEELSFCILTRDPAVYSIRRLREEILKRDHKVEILDPVDLYSYISPVTSGHDRIYKKEPEKDKKIHTKDFDIIIPRIAGRSTFDYSCTIVEQFEKNKKIFSTASANGLKTASNKLLTAQKLSQNKIRTIKQVFARNPLNYKFLTDLVDGKPIVCKTQTGSQGSGVFILNDDLSISTTLQSFANAGIDIIIQKYIDTGTPKSDLRIYVIGAETENPKLFAYKRFSISEDFRSNYSLSKSGEQVELTEEEKEMSINACKACGLRIGAVDIMRDAQDDDKPYLNEVNGNGGLKGIEAVTEKNIAGAIIEYCEENYKNKTYDFSTTAIHNDMTIAELFEKYRTLEKFGQIFAEQFEKYCKTKSNPF